jgi:MSHA biogenesis protein MshM
LDDNLAAVHVRQIKDRITNSFYLPPMGVEDIRDYLMFRLRHAGYHGPNIFSHAAALLIARLSNGLIRRINILADKSMLAAYAHSATTINWRHVLAASRDSSFGNGLLGKQFIRLGLGLLLVLSLIAGSTLLPLTAAHPTGATLPSSAVLPVSTQPTAAPVSPPNLVGERRAAALNWLQQADPRHYSIQVLTAAADANNAIEQFLSQPDLQAQLGKFFVTDSVLKGNPMVNVVYGEFSSFSAANQALNALPDEVKRNQPYVRNVRDLQTAAEKS